MSKNRYNNYHKHTHYSNIFTPDTHTKIEDYCKRAVELNHTTYFTTEHGYGGDIFACKENCDKYGLKCVFAMEGYIVKNPLEQDRSNYHIVLIAKTNEGRKKINLASSRANIEGYYYKPRLFLEDLLNIDKDDIYVTSGCVSGICKDEDSFNNITIPLIEHFKDHFFLEFQPHNHPSQILLNKKLLEYYKKYKNYGIKIISANDSHYINPSDSIIRTQFLDGKHIHYPEEEGFILDYPDYETILERYKIQGVLTEEEAKEAIDNTLIFDECEEININDDAKMPSLFPNLTDDEKFEKLKKIAFDNFEEIKVKDNIKKEDYQKYIDEINRNLKVVKDTQEMHTADYFLLDYYIFKKGINDYGGIITRSGRGSCGAFMLNKMLGLTQIDKFTTNIPIYADRFMSTARTIENRSFPDIDANVVSQEPFVKASRFYLGENGCYPMLAYGTMQISESFRNICRSKGMAFEDFNEVAKDLDSYKDDEKWSDIIEEAKMLVDTIVSASVHPCSFLLLDKDIREEIGVVKLGDSICATITSDESDHWKYLKND